MFLHGVTPPQSSWLSRRDLGVGMVGPQHLAGFLTTSATERVADDARQYASTHDIASGRDKRREAAEEAATHHSKAGGDLHMVSRRDPTLPQCIVNLFLPSRCADLLPSEVQLAVVRRQRRNALLLPLCFVRKDNVNSNCVRDRLLTRTYHPGCTASFALWYFITIVKFV